MEKKKKHIKKRTKLGTIYLQKYKTHAHTNKQAKKHNKTPIVIISQMKSHVIFIFTCPFSYVKKNTCTHTYSSFLNKDTRNRGRIISFSENGAETTG